MNIFIGTRNIASQYIELTAGFEALGHTVFSFNTYSHNIIAKNATVDLDGLVPTKLFSKKDPAAQQKVAQVRGVIAQEVWEKAVRECDVFLYVRSTFDLDFSDLIRAKRLGKKVAYIDTGEFRFKDASDQEMVQHGMHPVPCGTLSQQSNDIQVLASKVNAIRTVERYADAYFSYAFHSQLLLRPYYDFPHYLNYPEIPYNPNQRKTCPKVLHAPSDPIFKGTRYWEAAFQALREDGYEFELVTLNHRPYDEVMDIYADADICAGQLFCPNGGKQELEFLAAGGVVLANLDPRYRGGLLRAQSGDSPVVHTDIDTVEASLRTVLDDHSLRCDLALQGRAWIEKNFNCALECQFILDAILGREVPLGRLTTPHFFRECYQPAPETLSLLNDSIAKVKRCQWYSECVPSGSRDGLVF